mmetsp:Transcript_6851/g.12576  ORF Transcript_6851/g.12576 Transcript_6851/m.12576 type:complete len:129 (+) Transcript_6851:63-449(+)
MKAVMNIVFLIMFGALTASGQPAFMAQKDISSRRLLVAGTTDPLYDPVRMGNSTWCPHGHFCPNGARGCTVGRPAPICLFGVMHKCTGAYNAVYRCSWWNLFCWALCGSYEEKEYCNHCSVPTALAYQ